MIPFTALETFASVLSASLFGAIFAFFDMILKILTLELNHIKKMHEHIFGDMKIFSFPKRDRMVQTIKEKHKFIQEIITFFKVIIFTVGFILLSYYSLDGAIRVYLLFFLIAFFFLFRFLSDKTLLRILDSVFLFTYGILVILLRIFCRPIVHAISKFACRISENAANREKLARKDMKIK